MSELKNEIRSFTRDEAEHELFLLLESGMIDPNTEPEQRATWLRLYRYLLYVLSLQQ